VNFVGNADMFDFDGDGYVSASHFVQFRSRFGGSICRNTVRRVDYGRAGVLHDRALLSCQRKALLLSPHFHRHR
jgi:hypothetical protein